MIKLWENETVEWNVKFDFDGEFLSIKTLVDENFRHILSISLGKSSELTMDRVKRATAKAVKTLQGLGVASLLFDAAPVIELLGAESIAAIAQGAELSDYRQENWKQQKASGLKIFIDVAQCVDADAVLAHAHALIRAVCFARNLVNCPANILTPKEMTRRMTEAAENAGIETQVIDETEAKALGMEAFLAVGTSAKHPPRLIVLRYRGGKPEQAPIALVGKGVTLDTGGYCLKAADSMRGIKGDMAGGAAVFGTLLALAENHIPVNVTAVIPAVENRIAPDSYIPGDVIGSMSGKTIEVLNTDAEGRLILADAVTYAIRCEKAAQVVDIATLTGAVVSMFGFTTAGYITNDERLNRAFMEAYSRSGEQYWRLPDFPEYRSLLDSSIADISNVSSGGCGTITAGLFIGAFTEGKPWLHIDIAGTAWVGSPVFEYQTIGATGAGVTTLYELCKSFS
ncbi:MAG: leucyl aminopeptidase [Christensenellaceae bacterium]|nr:leucyl aminopeptidase [Christensenellaceae bacterium]